MCPDHQIMSVYFDGELDSPWKEKFEKHLENCSSCREHLELYRLTRKKLAETSLDEARPLDASLKAAMERVWEKTGYVIKPKRRFWTGSLSIPIPVAAAAGLVMAVAIAALLVFRQPAKASDPQLAGMEVQELIPSSDMASFFQALGSDTTTDMVIIRLPEKTFKDSGEPQILRAADYSRGGGSR